MIGAVVGNYEITEKIGEGGMGAVFKGIDVMLEREVAIKMLRPELARQPNIVERFRTEAVTLAKLNHPFIATLYSFLRQGEDFFMVMEFVRGETFDNIIRRTGAIEYQRAVSLFCLALEGIDHAHKMGIIHRDIKPSNIMLTDAGSIKVMDFGIARVLGTDRMTRTGHLIGTVEYMSPEQVRGEETDARSDIYSLGILLYEMLTGRVPFSATSEYEIMRSQIEMAPTPPTEFAPHIPLAIEQAIMRSLAKKREARYQTAAEFRAVLHQQVGMVTTPLSNTAPVYHAPPTVASGTVPIPPPGEPVLKETRLGGQGAAAAALSGQPKETRLGGGAEASYQQQSAAWGAAQPQANQGLGALMSRLNWKHYTAAGVALVALISLPIALLGGGSTKTATPQTPTVVQPSQAQPAPAPAAAPVEAAPGAQLPPRPDSSPIDNQPGASGSTDSSGSKPARSRNTTGTKAAQTDPSSGSGSNSSSGSGSSASSGSSSTPAPPRAEPRREERNETARKEEPKKEEPRKEEQKKDKVSKVAEAADAVSGAVKKFGGLFGKKKKN
jgi:tRNA A-37 threonylcarbamoyl transferase component Bud32